MDPRAPRSTPRQSLMRRQRATLGSLRGARRISRRGSNTIDQIVAFHAGHNSKEAFEYFERTRSRVLFEQLADGAGAAVRPQRCSLRCNAA